MGTRRGCASRIPTQQSTLKSRRRGPIRTEFEYAIPYSDAVEILRTMCDGRVLDKVRHVITHAGAVWHVDVYEGILNGVVLAEVELQHADQKFDLPGWIGKEVTGDPKYRKINMETQHLVGLRESQTPQLAIRESAADRHRTERFVGQVGDGLRTGRV